ncbi:DNA internalization-related competence protein ComEC/Rec2, partial [Eggerthella lenta]|uniref:DNA internalization-related competence protein ComEC/Rec2 n=1 Tax=Eggerthella lenta TaxID=84112 RepID=UPI001E65D6E4
AWAAQHEAQLQGDGLSGRWRFEVAADGSQGPYGATCFARANLPDIGAVTVRLRFEEGEDPPRYGDVLEADATLSAPGGSSAAYCWRQGAVLEGTARRVVSCERADALGILTGLRNRAIDLIADEGTDDGAAVLAALVCGWRGALEVGDAYAAYQTSGLAHLVAVSGAHLSIVAGCAAALLRALRVPRRAGAVLQASFLLGFLVLAAAPPSAVRAAVMAFAGMFAFTARRRPAALSALAVCMIGCIALDPRTALAVSFALSALSTLGIVLFAGLFQAWIAQCFQRAPRLAREALSLTAASSLAAAPLAASLFSQVPVVAPLANVAAAPLFPVVCAGGLAAVLASLAVPAVAPALIGFASMGAGALTAVVRALASVPYASLPASVPLAGALLASATCAAALWLAWPRPSRRRAFGLVAAVACVMIGTVVVAPRLSGDEIVMLDVGQGDAFLVRSRGTAVLIDTGNQDRMLREALARHGAYRLDAVVITHGDDDHKGSLASLAGVVDVRRVLVAQDALSCGCEACVSLVADARKLAGDGGVVGLRQGDALQVGSFDLQTVWPERFSDEGGNADSLCLVADADIDGDGASEWRALFTGDAERDQLRALIDEGLVDSVDLYKVGHHGSKNALDDEEAAVLSPRIALVSAGARNRYGHPAQDTLDRLEAAGARVFRTDEQGDVSCKLTADRIEVETLR